MKRRPVGVILAAIVLGLASLFLLVMAALTLLGALIGAHAPVNPGGQPAPAGLIVGISVATAFFYTALAGWAITTLVGLVRLRPWSRISIMIIGGGTVVIGLFSACLFLAMPTLMASMPMPQNASADPHLLRTVFFSIAFACLLVSSIGVWWLVYFSLHRIREAFKTRIVPIHIAPDTYAQPSIASADFFQPVQQLVPQPVYAAPQTPSSGRPISITVLATLLFVCGTMVIPTLFLSQPLLVFGFVATGKIAIILKLVFALWTVAAGIGLLKLQRPAWHLAMTYCIFCILNTCGILLPGGMNRMRDYMHNLVARSPLTAVPFASAPTLDPFSGPFFNLIMIPSVLFGAAVIAFAMVLLWRARWAFGLAPRSDHAAA